MHFTTIKKKKIFADLTESKPAVGPMQFPPSPSSIKDLPSPSSMGLRIPISPQSLSFAAVNLSNKNFADGTSPDVKPLDKQGLVAQNGYMGIPDAASMSAFHGVKPDPYSKAFHDAFDAQFSALKNILENGITNSLVSQQVLLQNQQVQQLQQLLSVNSSEQWCNLIPQSVPTSQPLPVVNPLQSVPNTSSVLHSGFVASSVKQEPPMLV